MQALHDRLANFRSPATAIPEQENRDIAKLNEVRAVDDRAAAALGADEARAGQNRQMSRERILRDFQQAGEIAGRKALGLVPDQHPEGFQAGRLGQRGQGEDGFFSFHISRFMEMATRSQLAPLFRIF